MNNKTGNARISSSWWRTLAIVTLCALGTLSAGCASLHHGVVNVTDIAGFTGDPPRPPSASPDKTVDGASVWLNADGRIEAIKMANGKVFLFEYDAYGRINKLFEPTGAVLQRKGSGREWVRVSERGERTTFEGVVMVANDYSVIVLAQDGNQRVFNTNGYQFALTNVGGETFIDRIVSPNGRTCSFKYDAAGEPTYIQGMDGVVLSLHDDGAWYKTEPGKPEQKVDYLVARDPDDSTVYVKKETSIVAYGMEGVREVTIPGAPQK